jgi:diadenosine tetraphosphate (Ap4A) HIT family hydrolase
MAFLDIMPITRGHLLVATRRHVEKISGMSGEEGAEVSSLSVCLRLGWGEEAGGSEGGKGEKGGIGKGRGWWLT